MRFTLILRKLMGRFIEGSYTGFEKTYNQINNKIMGYPEPKNDIERALFQYECTMAIFGTVKCIVLNLASALMYIPYMVVLRRNSEIKGSQKHDAVCITDGRSPEIIPNSLRVEFQDIVYVNLGEKMSLDKEDAIYLRHIWTYKPLSFYFHLKLMMKLAMTSYCISMYNPKAIITWTESSFATSLISEYCEAKGVENIGIMHGERLYGLKLAFFRCSRYYAWDDDYVNLFRLMRCEPTQFHVELPPAVTLPSLKRMDKKYRYDYTFYLQGETQDSMRKLQGICKILLANNKKIAVRPHPRCGLPEGVILSEGVEIQSSKAVSIEESLERTEFVVAKWSTILYQAYYQNIPIIIDDCTVDGLYEKLKSRHCVLLKKPHKLLSEEILLLKNDEEKNI